MNESPLISVIIPAYNAERWLGDAVGSVLAQTIGNWEVVIVNDGSTDSTSAVARTFTDPRIRVIDKENGGVSSARNRGIQAAKGAFLFFLDADDVMLPDNLEERMGLLESSGAAWAFASIAIVDPDLRRTGVELTGVDENVLQTVLLAERPAVPGAGSNILVRRDCLASGIAFDETLSNAADQDFSIQLAAKYKPVRVPRTLVLYRMVPGSMSRNIEGYAKDHMRLYAKADRAGHLKPAAFRRRCMANMYWAIGGSWWLNAGRPLKGAPFFIRAVAHHPGVLVRPVRARLRRLFRPGAGAGA